MVRQIRLRFDSLGINVEREFFRFINRFEFNGAHVSFGLVRELSFCKVFPIKIIYPSNKIFHGTFEINYRDNIVIGHFNNGEVDEPIARVCFKKGKWHTDGLCIWNGLING